MNGIRLQSRITANQPLTVEHIDGPYSRSTYLKEQILQRGI